MIRADCHVHSNFSADSQTPMKDIVERAIQLNFTHICFTDHMDYDYPKKYEDSFVFDPESYFLAIEKLQNQYRGKIKILKGIEIGMQPYLASKYRKLISQYPFDFVICSTHLVDKADPYYKDYWINKTTEQGIIRYLESITENISVYQDFDAYGHIDYIIRYCESKENNFYEKYANRIDNSLKSIISAGKAIEVNTGGYKYGLEHPNPHEDIIKRYLELGGKLITIGSDAHQSQNIGFAFSKTRELLLSLNISSYAVFEQRKPIIQTL